MRIHRLVAPDAGVFALSGDMAIEHPTRLQTFFLDEAKGRRGHGRTARASDEPGLQAVSTR